MKTSKIMDAQTALKIHNALLSVDKKVRNINRGGCGSFASLLADTLNAHGYTKKATPSNEQICMGDHICVECDGFYFDSRDYCTTQSSVVSLGKEPLDIIGEIPVNDLRYVAIENRGDLWNDDYNADNNDLLKNQITDSLSFL